MDTNKKQGCGADPTSWRWCNRSVRAGLLMVGVAAALYAQGQDLAILRRADELLRSEAVWNRHDTRECPAGAKTLSLYCALERAIVESGRDFEHRAGVMEAVRLVVELAAPNPYEHRLMGYNNDPAVTFADMKRMLRLAELRMAADGSNEVSTIRGRLVQGGAPVAGAMVAVFSGDRKLADRKEVTAVTARDGSYQFAGLPSLQGWYVYAKMDSIASRGATVPVVVLTFPGETTVARDIEVVTAHTVRGRVVLGDGSAVPAGSRITVSRGCFGECPPYDVGDSQAVALPPDGAFLFRGLQGPVGFGVLVKGYGLHVDEPNGKPPGQDNYNERMHQMINLLQRVVKDDADVRIVLEPRAAPKK
jgi:hypothetical protein